MVIPRVNIYKIDHNLYSKRDGSTKPTLEEMLLTDTIRGDADRIKKLLEMGANPNATDKRGNPIVIVACLCGKNDAAKALIEGGANPESQDIQYGESVLYWGVRLGLPGVITALAQKGVNIDEETGEEGYRPIYSAIFRGHTSTVRALIESGAQITDNLLEINAISSAKESSEITKLLLEKGASVKRAIRESDKKTALMIVAGHGVGSPKTAKLLIDAGTNINDQDIHGDTALIHAIKNGSIAMIQTLLEAGADTTIKNNKGETVFSIALEQKKKGALALLHKWDQLKNQVQQSQETTGKTERTAEQKLLSAVLAKKATVVSELIANGLKITDDLFLKAMNIYTTQSGGSNCIKVLIKNGINPHARNKEQKTPLIQACRLNNNIEIIKPLLEAGSDVNAHDQDGNTPLIIAAKNKSSAVIEMLLKANADINAQNNEGTTALMNAVKAGNMKAISMLIEAAANVTLKNKNGKTALQMAEEHPNKNVLTTLQKALQNPGKKTHPDIIGSNVLSLIIRQHNETR